MRARSRLARSDLCFALLGGFATCSAALGQRSGADAPPAQLVALPSPSADRPLLALIGTVVGKNDGIAIFVNETTRAIVLLKPGEAHAGWTLRLIRSRDAIMWRDNQTIRIDLLERSDRSANLVPRPAITEAVPTAFKPPPHRSQ